MNARLFVYLTGLLIGQVALCGSNISVRSVLARPSEPAKVYTIKCVRDRNCLLVPVTINAHTTLMLFDTGADNITMSVSQLIELGLKLPLVRAAGSVQGINDGPIETRKRTATVSVGNYEKTGFPLNVQANTNMRPVLGFNFFKNYLVTVDMRAATITLTPPERAASLRRPLTDEGAVMKLSRSGNQFRLPVKVNGTQLDMLLDTGADGITLNRQQARTAKLVVPSNAVREKHRGVGGVVDGFAFTVPEISMGLLRKQNVKVSVIESPGMPYPLVGADFFQDCIYTIDDLHSEIAFEQI